MANLRALLGQSGPAWLDPAIAAVRSLSAGRSVFLPARPPSGCLPSVAPVYAPDTEEDGDPLSLTNPAPDVTEGGVVGHTTYFGFPGSSIANVSVNVRWLDIHEIGGSPAGIDFEGEPWLRSAADGMVTYSVHVATTADDPREYLVVVKCPEDYESLVRWAAELMARFGGSME